MLSVISENSWNCLLCPETTGKVNVFGKESEILQLIKDTGCSFTIDFSHLLARSLGKMSYKEMYDKVRSFKDIHSHFSGIAWREKGEWKHIPTPDSEIKKFVSALPKNKNMTIISEAPEPVKDSIRIIKALKESQ
jgi:deoxyribonuclease-4